MPEEEKSVVATREAAVPAGTAPGTSAELLLRAALERLVLLECRLGPAAPASPPPEALRREMQRAIERAAEAEAERDRLFSRLLAAERVRGSLTGQAPEAGQVDLAGFIAELRSELTAAQRERDAVVERNRALAAELRHSSPGPRGALEWAAQLSAEGLLSPPEAPLSDLWPDLAAGTPAERLVLGGAVRDLDSPDSAARAAALARLEGLPAKVAAPIVAAALGREHDPVLLGRTLRLAGRLGLPVLLPLVERERTHPDERVRAAALFAAIRLGGGEGAAVEDPAPRVRRGALLCAVLCAPEGVNARIERLAGDPDPGVRKLVAAAAAALPERPEPLLRRLANDDVPAVRRSALRALSAAPEIAGLPPAQRRRRLKQETPSVTLHRDPAPRARALSPTAGEGSTPAEAAGASALGEAIEGELRASLRGRTEAELAVVLGRPIEEIRRAAQDAIAAGQIVRRGERLHVG